MTMQSYSPEVPTGHIVCKLTGSVGPGANSHIIPKAFYNLGEPDKPAVVVNNAGKRPSRSRVGIYDRTILTADGEKALDKLDDYGTKILIDNARLFKPFTHDNQTLAFSLDNYDYTKLKLFFLSVIWRASVSSMPVFNRVKLGPYESIIKNMILTNNPGSPSHLSVFLYRYSYPETYSAEKKPFLFPVQQRFEKLNYYYLYLGEFTACIKMDRQPTPKPFEYFELKPTGPLIVIDRDWEKSKEKKIMLDIIAQTDGQFPGYF